MLYGLQWLLACLMTIGIGAAGFLIMLAVIIVKRRSRTGPRMSIRFRHLFGPAAMVAVGTASFVVQNDLDHRQADEVAYQVVVAGLLAWVVVALLIWRIGVRERRGATRA